MRDVGAGLGPDELIEPARELAFARLGEGIRQELGNGETEHAVAEEFQTLIVVVESRARARARVGQGKLEQGRIGEVVPKPGREVLERRFARP